MAGFLKKLFGGGSSSSSSSNSGGSELETLVEETLDGLIEKTNLKITYTLDMETRESGGNELFIDFSGDDEEMLTEKDGQLLDSIQLFIKRVIQHHFPEDRTAIVFDCNGFREEASRALEDLAERLKGIALEKNKSVYCRALPPKDRKVVHQYLADDGRVKSRSIGDGLYKKIKIYPTKHENTKAT